MADEHPAPYEYGCLYRPPTHATVPQRGWVGKRTSPVFGYGVVQYDRYLSKQEIETYSLVPLDLDWPTNARAGYEAFERTVMAAFADRGRYTATTPYGYTLALTDSTYAGVDYQVTSFDEHMVPTGHRDYIDFSDAVKEFWGALPGDERDAFIRRAVGIEGEPGAVSRLRRRRNPLAGARAAPLLGLVVGGVALAWGIYASLHPKGS